MAIEYTPQETSNLVNKISEGGAFQTGSSQELSTAKSFASEAVTAKIAAELAEANAQSSETASAASASASAVSASSSATSATASASSASAASASETAAELAETNAETAETSATSSASLASTSETNAATSETNAATSETAAAASETAAGTSETNAASSETAAGTSATGAAISASAASTSATAAADSETAAGTSETNAATSASAASTSATDAATSATNSATSASAASTSETNAGTSATAAATSATNSAASETNAATSEANAAASYDSFDDRYLGAKASAPTLDNDGDALIAGALYFNSTANLMKVWSGSLWLDAFAPSGTVSWGTISGNVVDQTDLQAALDSKLSLSGGSMTGPVTTNSTIDGRDVATDGSKLDGIEASADVTDTANVEAAGALMDSELTSIASVKSLNQGVGTTDSPEFGDITVTSTDPSSTASPVICMYRNSATPDDGDYLGQIKFQGESDTGITRLYAKVTAKTLDVTNGLEDGLIETAVKLNGSNVIVSRQTGTELKLINGCGLEVDGSAEFSAEITANGGIALGDNDKATFGTDDDLQIYHDGSNSYIKDAGEGSLLLLGQNLHLRDTSGYDFINCTDTGNGGTVALFHEGSSKLITTSTGIDVTGTVSSTDLSSKNGKLFLDDNGSHNGVINSPASLYVNFDSDNNSSSEKVVFGYDRDGTTGGATAMEINSTGIDVAGTATMDSARVGTSTVNYSGTDLTVGDNADSQNGLAIQTSTSGIGYVLFGDGSGASAYRGEINYAHSTDSMTLKTAGASRLNISSAGIDVTGTATMDGLVVSDSNLQVKLEEADGVYNPRLITYFDSSGTHLQHTWSSGASNLIFEVGGVEGAGTERMRIDSSGTLILSGNGGSATNSVDISYNGSSGQGSFNADSSGGNTFLTFGTSSSGSLSERMRIDSSGNVGIGTDSPSMKVNISHGDQDGLRFNTSNTAESFIDFGDTDDNDIGRVSYDHADNSMAFRTNNQERLRIDSSGNVGIGTSSPSTKLEIRNDVNATTDLDPTAIKLYNNSDGGSAIEFSNSVAGKSKISFGVTSNGSGTDDTYLGFSTGANASLSEAMRIDSAGNVGIGTSPTSKLHLYKTGTSDNTLSIQNGQDAYASVLALTANNDGGASYNAITSSTSGASQHWKIWGGGSANTMAFSTNGSEHMRIDSAGNLLVGKPSANSFSTAGTEIYSSGLVNMTGPDNQGVLFINRKGSDGDIAEFYKNGTSVGSIGTANADALTIGNSTGNLILYASTVAPCSNSSGGSSDGVVSLGTAVRRFKDLYLSGTVTTGNVLVGATSGTGDKIVCVATGSERNLLMKCPNGGANAVTLNTSGTADYSAFVFTTDAGSTQTGGIVVRATSTAFNTSSDYRLKDITGPLQGSGDYIDSLKPVEGTWKSDGSVFVGLLAHEADEVSRTKIATGEKDGEEMQGMDYSSSEMIANLIKEVQSLRNRVAQLEGS